MLESKNSDASFKPLKVSNALLGRHGDLDAAFNEDGYLFFRGVLDPGAVTSARNEFIEVLAEHGYAEPGSADAKWTGRDVKTFGGHPAPLYQRRIWQRLAEHPPHAALFESLIGEPTYFLPIAQYRFAAPEPNIADPILYIHQDGFFNQGMNFRVAWIALSDIDERVGGLALAPGYHKGGFLHDTTKPPLFRIPPGTIPRDAWHSAHYRPGDMIVFHINTPHSGLANRSDRLRLSLDIRFQPASANRPIVGTVSGLTAGTVSVRDAEGTETTLQIDDDTYFRRHNGERMPVSMMKIGEAVMVSHQNQRAIVIRPPITDGY